MFYVYLFIHLLGNLVPIIEIINSDKRTTVVKKKVVPIVKNVLPEGI